MAEPNGLEHDLQNSLDSYKTDYRKFKIGNIIAIVKTIKENNGIKLDDLLSICNVNEPFINKEKTFGYVKDMIKAGKIEMDKKTKVVTLCV